MQDSAGGRHTRSASPDNRPTSASNPSAIGYVGAAFFAAHDSTHQKGECVVHAEKLKPITVRVDTRVWRHVERLAAAEKRPVANYLRLVLSELVAAKSGQAPKAAA
jgi:hypothetical protein